MEGNKLKSLKLYPIELYMDGNKSEIGLPRLSTDPDLLSDFVARCEREGTILKRNADGTYDCSWN
jgi:hypothetical protein